MCNRFSHYIYLVLRLLVNLKIVDFKKENGDHKKTTGTR